MPSKINSGDLGIEQAMAIAKEIVAIPSFKGEESALADWTSEFLDSLGYEVEQQVLPSGQRQTLGHLKAQGDRPTVMFNGHLDIDPMRANWTRDPFEAEIVGNLLVGAGARNMQGGLTSILMAARALAQESSRANVVVALVAGELQGGLGTKYALRQGLSSDLAIVPEPFGVDNLITETWGVIELAVIFEGASEHISKLERSVNPLPVAMLFMEEMKCEFAESINSESGGVEILFNVGGVLAGRGDDYSLDAANYSPDRVVVLVDIRHSSLISNESVITAISDWLELYSVHSSNSGVSVRAARGGSTKYKLNEIDFPPHRSDLKANLSSFMNDRRVMSLGRGFTQTGAVFPHSYCGADTAHLGESGIPSVLVGPTGPLATPGIGDDGVFLDEVLDTAKFLQAVGLGLDWVHL